MLGCGQGGIAACAVGVLQANLAWDARDTEVNFSRDRLAPAVLDRQCLVTAPDIAGMNVMHWIASQHCEGKTIERNPYRITWWRLQEGRKPDVDFSKNFVEEEVRVGENKLMTKKASKAIIRGVIAAWHSNVACIRSIRSRFFF